MVNNGDLPNEDVTPEVQDLSPEIRLPRRSEAVVSLIAAIVISIGTATGIYFHNKKFEVIACRQRDAVKKCLNEGDTGTNDGKARVKACANSILFEGDFIKNDHELGKLVREASSGEEESVCEEPSAD